MHDVHVVSPVVEDVTSPILTSTSDETDDAHSTSSSTDSLMSPIHHSIPATHQNMLFMTPPNRMSTPLDSSDGEGIGDISMRSSEFPDSIDLNVSSTELNMSMISPANESTLSIHMNSDTTCPDIQSEVVPQSVNAGVKLVIDNIDKTIKPRHMTLESQTTSLNYVQAIAIKDRIDYSFLSDKIDPERESDLYDILPNGDDYDSLKKRFYYSRF